MRKKLPQILEKGRLKKGPYATSEGDLHGAFHLIGPGRKRLAVLCSGPDTDNFWEHVSVSGEDRTPTWEEMCHVKRLFWEDHECVIQLHPPASAYDERHPHVLHLWRDMRRRLKLPPAVLTKPLKDENEETKS